MHKLTKAALRKRKRRRLVVKPQRQKLKQLTKEMVNAAIADRLAAER